MWLFRIADPWRIANELVLTWVTGIDLRYTTVDTCIHEFQPAGGVCEMLIPVYSLNKSIERQEANNPGLSDILNRVFCLPDTCITKTVGRGSALHQYIYQSCEQLASSYLFKDRPCYRGKINYFQLRFNTNRRTVSPPGQALWQAQAVALLQRDCGINPKQHKSSPTATRQVTSSTIIFSVILSSPFSSTL